jgi:O-antigen/teichoic acid export membrane protein
MQEQLLAPLRRMGAATLLLQVGGLGLMFLAHVLLGRAAGPANYGMFAFTIALVNLALVAGKAGQDSVVLRYAPIYAGSGQSANLRALVRWSTAYALAGSLLVIGPIFAWWMLSPVDAQLSAALAWGMVALPLLAMGAVRSNALMGLGRVVAAQAPELAIRPLVLIGFAAAALLGGRALSGPAAVAAYAAAAAIAFLLGAWLLGVTLRNVPSRSQVREAPSTWFKFGAWMILVTGAYQAFGQIDLAMVGLLLSKQEAGIYAAASRLSVLVQYGLIALQIVVAPKIAVAHANGRVQDVQKLVTHLAVLASAFAVAASLVLIALAGPILGLFGDGFAGGTTVLRILVLAHVANAVTGATGTLLTMCGHQREVAVVVTLALLAALGLHFLVIPRHGLAGAAWVTVAATATTHLALAAIAWRKLGMRSWIRLDD